MNINKIFEISWLKTIWINFRFFPIKNAIRFPILVCRHTVFRSLRGGVKVEGIPSTGMLQIGFHKQGNSDRRKESTILELNGIIVLKGKSVYIGSGSKFTLSGTCTFGDNFNIIGNSTIICKEKITFGENVLISWDVLLMDTDFHHILNETGKKINPDKPIEIGDNVWIGCRSTILKGSSIPSNSIIASCSCISGKMEKQGCIYSTRGLILKEKVTWQY